MGEPLGLFRQVAAMAVAGHLLDVAWRLAQSDEGGNVLFFGLSSKDVLAVVPHARLGALDARMRRVPP